MTACCPTEGILVEQSWPFPPARSKVRQNTRNTGPLASEVRAVLADPTERVNNAPGESVGRKTQEDGYHVVKQKPAGQLHGYSTAHPRMVHLTYTQSHMPISQLARPWITPG